ncbi:protein FAR1-RELATED SEQUENCE 5-like [Mangifera indica]|uniref:protein FAR1-RELATED SEQUENCE 5-like n=1 Tax=Mangifera indica TaxID=29780 RepID=UPI001CFB4FE9|nr:protein FAR1-RELATED SEQUENCE 5-like [Mangifera indica]
MSEDLTSSSKLDLLQSVTSPEPSSKQLRISKMEECSQTNSKNTSSHFNVIGDNHFEEIDYTRSLEEEWEPKPGMVYDLLENLVQDYKSYGNRKGFKAIIRSTTKGDDGDVKYVALACSCHGKARSNCRNAFKMHPMTKIDCKARIRASIRFDDKWTISSAILDHNHELNSPAKTRYFKSNRIIHPSVKRKLEVNDRAGIRPNKNFNALIVEAGGAKNLPFLQKDCRNYIEKVKRLRLGVGDASAIQKYFLKMQSENSNFFNTMDLDEEGRLKNVLWVDTRSRAAFKEFGDVVTFDTTYLTNKYDMPFGAFVGVDHHGHSILFGCGLISNEDTETFVWLFKSWLACMSTTQRSESMHSFFDGYVNSKTTLKQFVEQYENALRDKVEKERDADFKSFKSWIPCISTYPMEKQFQDAYTIAKFKEFQQELAAKIYCGLSSFKKVDSYMEFIVQEDVVVGETHRRVTFVVRFDESTYDIHCNCRMFEFRGILCRHAIVVLIEKQISHVPDKFM